MRAGRALGGGAALVLAGVFCACGDDGQREALIFVDRAERISVESPISERRDAVAALEALPLEHPDVVRVRDACVRGHRAMLTAEEEQLEASRALGAATGGAADSPIDPEQARRIQASLDRSNAAIGEARDGLRACDQGLSGLRSRFASRR